MQKKHLILSIIFIVLTIAINAFIIYQSCLNAGESSEWSGTAVEVTAEVINAVKPNTINESNINIFAAVIRKLYGHFGLFCVSGALTSLSVYFLMHHVDIKFYLKMLIALPLGIIVAAITEGIQLGVPGRSGEIRDIFIDLGGYATGLLVTFLICILVFYHILRKKFYAMYK